MRRRIALALVLTVVGALLVAGVGTLALTAGSERRSAEAQLREQSASIARRADAVAQPGVFTVFVESLRLNDASVVFYDEDGQVIDPADVPSGVSANRLDIENLARGSVVSGSRGRTVYAAAALELDRLRSALAAERGRGDPAAPPARQARRRPVLVPPGATGAAVVLTRRLSSEWGVAGGYFLLAAGLALLVAVAVADALSRRISRPLLATESATRRIAQGDLSARVPVQPGEVPELVSLAGSVNTMAEALAASKGLERQFLLSVSHELRTPLTSIQGFAEAIGDDATPDPHHAASVIGSEARRLSRLVGDLLLLAKLDARAFTLEVVPTDLVEVSRDTADGFGPKAEELGLVLDLGELPPPELVPRVLADPDRLAQVTANLVENALKYARSRVSVGIEPGAVGPMLVVTDDGPGISPADLSHVFERLYQSPTRVSSRQVGSGLGLAIVAELVAAMGGTVEAEPARSGGSRMVVRCRLAATPTPGPPPPPSWSAGSSPGAG